MKKEHLWFHSGKNRHLIRLSPGLLHRAIWQNFTNVSETANTSKTFVNFYKIPRRNNPEESPPHTYRTENPEIQRPKFNMWTSVISKKYFLTLIINK